MPKETNSRHQPKKTLDQRVLQKLNTQEPKVGEMSSSRKRLKKMADVNQHEDIVEDDHTEKLQDYEAGEEKYEQFGVKDDEQLQRQKEEAQNKKRQKGNKGAKGSLQLDSFLSKRGLNLQKKEKEKQPKKVQLTLQEMSRIKKERKRRRSSDDFVVSDHPSMSVQAQEQEARNKYKQFNGSFDDEKRLLEKAMKESLIISSSAHKSQLTNFTVEDNLNQALKLSRNQIREKREEKEKEKVPEKRAVSKSKGKKQKEKGKDERTGPLKDLVIAFTGEFQDYDKQQVIQVCMQLGAECPKSLTRKCNLLIQGAFVMDHFKRKMSTPINETGKSKEALQRHIRIVPHNELDDLFINKTGHGIQHHINANKVQPSLQQPDILQSFQYKKIDQNQRNQPFAMKTQSIIKKMDIENNEKVAMNYKAVDGQLWTEKYKPTRLTQVVGQNSQIKQLRQWLEAWQDIHYRGNKREVKEHKSGWNAAGSINSKAALISGDPGIGKTTSARLLAMELNYLISQFNASDVRNKSGINLMESSSFSIDASKNLQKTLIIMDQVDGMSSGDRGGVAAIIQMIKNSKVPIICICNDRSSEKIRSLAGHCLDIKFHKPSKPMLVRRLKDILVMEGGSGEDRALQLLTQTFQNDMRQILNYLQMVYNTTTISKKITLSALSDRQRHAKDASVMINHFDAARRLLNRTEFDGLKVSERTQCFFVNSDLVPLMIEENLLSSSRKTKMNMKDAKALVQGMQGLVLGDLLDKTIHRQQEWGLMPSFGFMSCVYTTQKISDAIGFPQFPSWLGKNSSERKNKRLVKQLKNALYPMTMCSSFKSVKSYYSSLLMQQIVGELKSVRKDDDSGVDRAVDLMQLYRITPEKLSEHLTCLTALVDKISPLTSIPAPTKAKLTRTFNKRHQENKLKNKKAKKVANEKHIKFDPVLEQEEIDDQEEEVDMKDEEEEESDKNKKKNKKK